MVRSPLWRQPLLRILWIPLWRQHGNRDFLDYCLSRTDTDTLLLPLLPMLYETRSLLPNQVCGWEYFELN